MKLFEKTYTNKKKPGVWWGKKKKKKNIRLDRGCAITYQVNESLKIRIICAYAPREDKKNEEKKEFYKRIEKELKKCKG